VHISRVLKALRDDKLITFERRQLIIHDWPRLYDAAAFDPTYLHLKSLEC
jgi:transcription initiation factor IIE alpha subunit